MVQIGKQAIDFKTTALIKGKFTNTSLSEYASKWVLLIFYPADFSFVCATEIAGFASRYKDFQKLEVEILAISVDSLFVHKIWNDQELSKLVKGGVPFPMLTDAGGAIGNAYGVYQRETGVEARGRFILDPDGTLQGYEILTAPVGRSVKETYRQIQAFQAVWESKGTKVASCEWKTGQPLFSPSSKLVGQTADFWNISQVLGD